jgi:quercetin dioxygenase-like cupin family protein
MKLKFFFPFCCLVVSSCSTTKSNKKVEIAEQRPPVHCMENSPERHGEEGCTILTNRRLVGLLPNTVYWHIDRFESLEAAMKGAGPNSVAAEAHGGYWLMTVDGNSEDHYGGNHITSIGPLVMPIADSFSMRVQSSLLKPGATTPAHTHPGPEVIYIVDGEQCMQMPGAGMHLSPGESYVVPGNTIHRGTVIGSKARRALALNLYDAAHPTSHDLDNPPPMVSCK